MPDQHSDSRTMRCATLAITLMLCAASLPGQGGTVKVVSPPMTPDSALADRVVLLEQKLAALQLRLSKDEAARGGGSQAGLSDADQKRMADLEAQMKALEEAQKKKNDASDPLATRVTAPFQVVDRNGVEILSVEDGGGRAGYRGLRVYAKNDSFTQIGSPDGGQFFSSVSVHRPGEGHGTLFMGIKPTGVPAVAIVSKETHEITSELTENMGHGELQLSTPAGLVVALIGSNPKDGQGHAKFANSGGKYLLSIGSTEEHGDIEMVGSQHAFDAWDQFVLGLVGVPH